MKMFVFSIKDRATDAFSAPMMMPAVGAMVRQFTDEVNRNAPDNQLFQHPDDFDLYECGSFDTDDGSFDCDTPRLLTRGKDVSLTYGGAN